jgi:hypothetical protein
MRADIGNLFQINGLRRNMWAGERCPGKVSTRNSFEFNDLETNIGVRMP